MISPSALRIASRTGQPVFADTVSLDFFLLASEAGKYIPYIFPDGTGQSVPSLRRRTFCTFRSFRKQCIRIPALSSGRRLLPRFLPQNTASCNSFYFISVFPLFPYIIVL